MQMSRAMPAAKLQAGGGGKQGAVANGGAVGVIRGPVIATYEQQLGIALWLARIIGLLHALSRFLALCSLTWATVVLLGAFVTSLNHQDFSFVACLLLLDACRLASASFFSRLLTRGLAHLSPDPRLIIDHAQDAQYCRVRLARFTSQVLELLFISPSLILPAMALFGSSIPLYPVSDDTHNLVSSLRIFYSLVGVNSLVALLHLVCSAVASLTLRKSGSEQSVLRYFDKVLENAMSSGVVQADEFDMFSFAYSMLAGEFRRNVQAEAVARNHKELIRYLYASRLGVDVLLSFLDADDGFVRLAAANMVGFWADMVWGVGVGAKDEQLALPEEVLMKLADKVGTGKVGWAANSSIGALARRPAGARMIASAHTTRGKRLADRLVDLIDSSSRSLSIVRTLVTFYEQLSVTEQQPPTPFDSPETKLVPKLKLLASEAKRHRLRVQAAYLLLIMGFQNDATVISAIVPTSDAYWFESEVSMLKLLHEHIDVPPPSTEGLDIKKDAGICSPAWAQVDRNIS